MEFVDVVFKLLPGFISAGIFYLLTSYEKSTPFERVVQALVMTAFVKTGVIVLNYIMLCYNCIENASDDLNYVLSIILAVLLGLLLSWCVNNDIPNLWFREDSSRSKLFRYTIGLLSKLHLTNKTLHPSEWFSFFRDFSGLAILHLDGERRLIGFILQYPDSPEKGHFILINAGWIDDDNKIIPLDNVEKMLISSKEVIRVEFIKKEVKNDNQRSDKD